VDRDGLGIRGASGEETAIGEGHPPILGKGLEGSDDMGGGLVRFINNENTSVQSGTDEGGVLVGDDTGLDGGDESEALDSGVAVELDILARPAHEFEEAIDELVLPDPLVTHEEDVLVWL
jgi:hypothetical protein